MTVTEIAVVLGTAIIGSSVLGILITRWFTNKDKSEESLASVMIRGIDVIAEQNKVLTERLEQELRRTADAKIQSASNSEKISNLEALVRDLRTRASLSARAESLMFSVSQESPFMYVVLHEDSKIARMSRHLAIFLGLSANQGIGRQLSDVWPEEAKEGADLRRSAMESGSWKREDRKIRINGKSKLCSCFAVPIIGDVMTKSVEGTVMVYIGEDLCVSPRQGSQ